MRIKLTPSELRDIPDFESVTDTIVRDLLEKNARMLETRFAMKITEVLDRHLSDPELVHIIQRDVMYLLTHTEVVQPILTTADD